MLLNKFWGGSTIEGMFSDLETQGFSRDQEEIPPCSVMIFEENNWFTL